MNQDNHKSELVLDGMGSLPAVLDMAMQVPMDSGLAFAAGNQQETQKIAEAWVSSLIVREKGQRLKRNRLAKVVHEAVAVGERPVIDFKPVEDAPKRVRFQNWISRLSPRNRDIDEVMALAHDMGRDFDEGKAQRFLDYMRDQERAERRQRFSRILSWLAPHPHP